MARARLRICITVDSPYAGGAEHYVELIARGLDRDYFTPHILASSLPGLDAWCDRLEAGGVRVTRAPMGLPFKPWHAGPLWNHLEHMMPDVVHVNMPGPYDGQMGLLAPLARVAGASSAIVTEHLPMVERLWKRAALKGLSYRWVDKVLTICEANVPFLVKRQGVPSQKIRVVYNATPDCSSTEDVRVAERVRLGLSYGESVIVFVGSLIERKGVRALLAAVNEITNQPWCLLIAGEGPDETAFRQRAEQSSAADRIRFVGPLDGEGVRRLLAAADILVVPSFMEGMPYVILEAMSCSLPVVASEINGIPEAVTDGNTGLLTPPGDVDAIREAIQTLLDNEVLRLRMGEAARRQYERMFTMAKHLSAMEDVYVEAASRRTDRREPA